jgi:RimJ/RimL family protein N-acetyltransferase
MSSGASIRDYRPQDFEALMAMYRTFEPRGAARGLPPLREEKAERWLTHLGARAKNLVAMGSRGTAAGHVVLAEGDNNDAELALFVHQDYRGQGLGTRLAEAAVALARKFGYTRLWLSVAPDNLAAIRVYEKAGFHMIQAKWFPDHEMELWL